MKILTVTLRSRIVHHKIIEEWAVSQAPNIGVRDLINGRIAHLYTSSTKKYSQIL